MPKRIGMRIVVGLVAAGVVGALVHCSELTEIVVAVDTDLAPGTDFDRVEVRVLSDGVSETKPGEVRSAAALPATLGITAGNNTSASVVVEATAFKGGTSVARTTVTASMVEGKRKLLHVSLCQSCPLDKQCGRSFGTSMPDYSDALPTKDECSGIFADAGGFDSGVPPNDDGGIPPTDSGNTVDGGDSGGCALVCPQFTSCKFNACQLDGNQACNAPVVIDKTTKVRGKICPGTGQASFDFGASCGTTHPTAADIFQLGDGNYSITLRPLGTDWIVLRSTNSTCSNIGGSPGCTTAKSPSGPTTTSGIGPMTIAVGADKAICTEYEVTFTKQ